MNSKLQIMASAASSAFALSNIHKFSLTQTVEEPTLLNATTAAVEASTALELAGGSQSIADGS
jgi:hypothetical protein